MQRILVPIDFSTNAQNAYEYALWLAGKYKASITLLHVYSIPVTDPFMPVWMIENLNEGQIENAEKLFREYETFSPDQYGDGQLPDVEVNHLLRAGFPAAEICNAAKELDADLIVMGTKGAANVAEQLIGGITAAVINRCKTAVLAVPQDAAFSGVDRILYATDFNVQDHQVIKDLLELSEKTDADLYCTHMYVSGSKDKQQEALEGLRQEFQREFEDGLLAFDVHECDDVVHGIDEEIASKDIDLLVMLNRDQNFFERLFSPSQSRRMVLHTDVPLLVYHTA